MKAFLRDRYGPAEMRLMADGLRETKREMFVHARDNVDLPSILDLDDDQQREVLESPDVLRMTIVRNPYSRLVSVWSNKIRLCEPGYGHVYVDAVGSVPGIAAKRLLSFDEFVKYMASSADVASCNNHWRLQTEMAFPSAIRFGHVGKVERLRDTEAVLRERLGIPGDFRFGRSNASALIPEVRLTEEMAATIYSLYEADFLSFGYDKGDVPVFDGRFGDISEERFAHEIVERNLILDHLYDRCDELSDECRRLQGELDRLQVEFDRV
jgi:hypothetical protein